MQAGLSKERKRMSEKKRDFDKEASTWDEHPVRVKLASDVCAALCANVPFDTAMNVLDFGCGTGLVTFQIAPLVGTITGADSSQGMLDVLAAKAARQGADNVQTLFFAPEGGDVLTGPYDAIVSSMTLHHVEHIAPLLGQFHACLAPGGWLCLADLDPDGGLFHADNTGVFHAGFERTALRAAFVEAGFEDVADTTAAEVVRPDAQGEMRRFSVFLMTGRRG
jgi:2-polyprenyl-3-methyl-5-hydroxy-6-metoxy-1,4-benzoquinol methylase